MRPFLIATTIVMAFSLPSFAQERTVPAQLDFTCHGYDEGTTRAYNCIPAEGHEQSMSTFVPPAGSTCNGGRIDEFPAGRRVFQIKCQEPSTVRDFSVQNVRRYQSSIDVSQWIYFDIVGGPRSLGRFTIEVRLHYSDGTYRLCNEPVAGLAPGQRVEGLVIPSLCGPDVNWQQVEILPPASLTCSGCGVYSRTSVEDGRAIPAGAPDSALEADRVIEDYRRRSTIER